jgi:hypothetical protein
MDEILIKLFLENKNLNSFFELPNQVALLLP